MGIISAWRASIFNFVVKEVNSPKAKIIAEAKIPARLTHLNISRCFRGFGKIFTEGLICKADPIEAVKEHGAVLLTATQEYPEQADDIIIACIDAHGLEWIDSLSKEMLESEAVTRRIARYKLTTPMEDQ